MNNDSEKDDGFAEQIARPLRTPEHTTPDFAARVMSAVRASAHSEQRWWARPRMVRMTPRSALAAAAALLVMFLGVDTGARKLAAPPLDKRVVAAPAVDTVVFVRFVFVDPTARSVALVGSFNGWQRSAAPLRAAGNSGAWVVSISLHPGRHEYAFVVNDGVQERWVADPLTWSLGDEFGVKSSFVLVKPEVTTN